MTLSFTDKDVDAALANRIKAAFAVCAAGTIFEQAASRPNNEAKVLRIRIAADALDKTAPDARIFDRYQAKPEGQTDAEFLLANIDSVTALPPVQWPERKVKPRDWNEYTRLMRGLEVFLQKAFTGVSFTKAEQNDVEGALKFIQGYVARMEEGPVRFCLRKGFHSDPVEAV